MTREEMQKYYSDCLIDEGNLIAMWATGTGKTNLAIYAILRLLKEKGSDFRILIVVAETAHKDNWITEFKKFMEPEIYEKVSPCITIICYASLKKYVNTSWDILVLDEGHHAESVLRMSCLSSMKATRVLVLSATLKRDTIFKLEQIFGSFRVSRFSMQKAIDNKILRKPKIFVVPLHLDDLNQDQVIIIKRGTGKDIIKCKYDDRWMYLRAKLKDTSLVISCTEQQKYDYLASQCEYWEDRYMKEPGDSNLKRKWLQAGMARKRFLGNLKTRYVFPVIERLRKEHKRFICFCSSIQQAEDLGERNAISSKNSRSFTVIRKFNEGVIDEMYAVGMITEGQNLSRIQAGIIVQLDNEERLFIQKFGRTMRADSPEQYILFFNNTRDQVYLEKALKDINKDYVKVLWNV